MASGNLDINALRDALTPEEVERWAAYDRLHPVGDSWEIAAQVICWVVNELRLIRWAMVRREDVPEDNEFLKPKDVIPTTKNVRKWQRMSNIRPPTPDEKIDIARKKFEHM